MDFDRIKEIIDDIKQTPEYQKKINSNRKEDKIIAMYIGILLSAFADERFEEDRSEANINNIIQDIHDENPDYDEAGIPDNINQMLYELAELCESLGINDEGTKIRKCLMPHVVIDVEESADGVGRSSSRERDDETYLDEVKEVIDRIIVPHLNDFMDNEDNRTNSIELGLCISAFYHAYSTPDMSTGIVRDAGDTKGKIDDRVNMATNLVVLRNMVILENETLENLVLRIEDLDLEDNGQDLTKNGLSKLAIDKKRADEILSRVRKIKSLKELLERIATLSEELDVKVDERSVREALKDCGVDFSIDRRNYSYDEYISIFTQEDYGEILGASREAKRDIQETIRSIIGHAKFKEIVENEEDSEKVKEFIEFRERMWEILDRYQGSSVEDEFSEATNEDENDPEDELDEATVLKEIEEFSRKYNIPLGDSNGREEELEKIRDILYRVKIPSKNAPYSKYIRQEKTDTIERYENGSIIFEKQKFVQQSMKLGACIKIFEYVYSHQGDIDSRVKDAVKEERYFDTDEQWKERYGTDVDDYISKIDSFDGLLKCIAELSEELEIITDDDRKLKTALEEVNGYREQEGDDSSELEIEIPNEDMDKGIEFIKEYLKRETEDSEPKSDKEKELSELVELYNLARSVDDKEDTISRSSDHEIYKQINKKKLKYEIESMSSLKKAIMSLCIALGIPFYINGKQVKADEYFAAIAGERVDNSTQSRGKSENSTTCNPSDSRQDGEEVVSEEFYDGESVINSSNPNDLSGTGGRGGRRMPAPSEGEALYEQSDEDVPNSTQGAVVPVSGTTTSGSNSSKKGVIIANAIAGITASERWVLNHGSAEERDDMLRKIVNRSDPSKMTEKEIENIRKKREEIEETRLREEDPRFR